MTETGTESETDGREGAAQGVVLDQGRHAHTADPLLSTWRDPQESMKVRHWW